MASYLGRRILGAVVTVFVIASIVFVLLNVTSNPVGTLITGDATPAQIQAVRVRLGVDRPLWVQYRDFIAGIVTGRMQDSYRFQSPAMELVLERVPATAELALSAFALAVIIAFPLGILAAVFQDTIIDHVASALAFFGFAIPAFWLGSMLIIVFGVQLHLLPTFGQGGIEHLILPTVTLAMWPLGQLTRLIRSELLNVIREDFVRTAQAKGLRRRAIVIKHALRNAMLPILTLMGLLTGTMLGGTVVTETIFAWPGMGRLTLQAALNRDFPVIEAGVVFLAIVFNVINLVTDLLYVAVDPRIKTT